MAPHARVTSNGAVRFPVLQSTPRATGTSRSRRRTRSSSAPRAKATGTSPTRRRAGDSIRYERPREACAPRRAQISPGDFSAPGKFLGGMFMKLPERPVRDSVQVNLRLLLPRVGKIDDCSREKRRRRSASAAQSAMRTVITRICHV